MYSYPFVHEHAIQGFELGVYWRCLYLRRGLLWLRYYTFDRHSMTTRRGCFYLDRYMTKVLAADSLLKHARALHGFRYLLAATNHVHRVE